MKVVLALQWLASPYVAIFFMTDMVAHMRGMVCWPDSMKCMHIPSSKCVLFRVLLIQLLKKHTLNPEVTILNLDPFLRLV